MRDEHRITVRELALFRDIAEESFDTLLTASFLQRFPPGVELISEGEPADFLYVVVDGLVELFARHNGKDSTLAIMRPVGTFILAATLKDAVYLMSARTLEQSRVLMIPSSNVRDVFAQDADFARAIVVELSNSYRSVVRELKGQKLRTGVERLANYLLLNHQGQGGQGTVELDIDKRTVASRLGMTPENLSRAFTTLGPYGVEVDGRTITLTNLKDLEVLAKPTPLIDDQSS